MIKEHKVSFNLSGIIIVLMIISSLGGLFIDNLYRDNLFVSAVWRGNDFVTLFVAVPIFIASLLFAKRGEPWALLVWFSMLWYTFYNYIFYLFGSAFNAFFLLYVALFTLSLYALIFGLPHLDVTGIKERFSTGMRVKWISCYMLFVAAGLSVVYIMQSVNFIVTGQLPEIIELTAHPASAKTPYNLYPLKHLQYPSAQWSSNRRCRPNTLPGSTPGVFPWPPCDHPDTKQISSASSIPPATVQSSHPSIIPPICIRLHRMVHPFSC